MSDNAFGYSLDDEAFGYLLDDVIRDRNKRG